MMLLTAIKQFFKKDKTVYYCNYCGSTDDIRIFIYSGFNICGNCRKEAFDRILSSRNPKKIKPD